MQVFLFPGQGTQSKGMGAGLFAQYPEIVSSAEAILGYSIEELCLKSPDNRLDDTRYTQPAVFTVSVLSYLEHLRHGGDVPAFVAGHSLGEYAALFAAGAFDFATGLRIVQRRAELMSLLSHGAMAAVIGRGRQRIRELLQTHELGAIDIANYNGPSQHVLAGPAADIERARSVFEAKEEGEAGQVRYVPLRIGAPFHSRYMNIVRQRFAYVLERYQFAPLRMPVIANVDAAPYADGDIAERLSSQIDQPVLWEDSIRYLLAQGAEDFVEIGPSTILSKMVQDIQCANAA